MNVNYRSTYGYRSVNPKTAFDIGFENAVNEGMGSGNPTMSVKTRYEQQLRNYLKKLPADMDFSQIPSQYRGKLSNYLSKKKNEYVRSANSIDELGVGSDDYRQTVGKRNEIKNSFPLFDVYSIISKSTASSFTFRSLISLALMS